MVLIYKVCLMAHSQVDMFREKISEVNLHVLKYSM